MFARFVIVPIVVLTICCAVPTRADTTIQTVSVANPGNPAQTHGGVLYGRVDYVYEMGTYEVTAGQYTDFLNAVAATDTYALYNLNMANTQYGSGIGRTGLPGSHTYSVAPAFVSRPVNYVSWADAARFANWLHNGQPTGAQDLTTTETGSYHLDGATTDADLMSVLRAPQATWVIPTVDEWYKAAYHQNDGITANYWDYPTSSDTDPGRDLEDASGNNANWYGDGDPYPIQPPHFTTVVGEFQNSASPYGTFDQGGNVWEWLEAPAGTGLDRLLRGSCFHITAGNDAYWMRADYTGEQASSTFEGNTTGFRLARIPDIGLLPGDLNGDGVVNTVDADLFFDCMGAPGQTPGNCDPPIAGRADSDDDYDVDLRDFAHFQRHFGPVAP